MRVGSYEWYIQKYKDTRREEAQLRYRDKLKVFLGLNLQELKEAGHPIYDIVKKAFPNLDEMATLDEARIVKLFDKIFNESSLKALELTYRLDGSMSDLENDPDYERVERETVDIK